jgi:PAS domain-containing protein
MLTKLAAIVMDQMELRLAARKVADLEQVERRMSEQLRQANEALVQSEQHFHDLFDEAPIAYVHEGLDSRFIQANRAAMRILGIKPEEIAGMFGKSLVPDTPDVQRRLVRRSTLSDAALTQAASCSNCVARTTASLCGSSGGPGRARAAARHAPCSWISPH